MKGGFTFGLPLSRDALAVLRKCKKMFPTGDHVFQYDDPSARGLDAADIRSTARELMHHGRVSYRRLFAELKARFGCRGKTETVMGIWREECGVSREGALTLPLEDTAPTRPREMTSCTRPVDDCNTAAFEKACKRAELPDINWHTLRHTWASWAVQSGVSLQKLMHLGDWRSLAMVQKYAHLCPDDLAEAANLVTRKGHTASKRAGKNRKRSPISKQNPHNIGGERGTRTLDLGVMSATL
jgi:hypothetical protein